MSRRSTTLKRAFQIEGKHIDEAYEKGARLNPSPLIGSAATFDRFVDDIWSKPAFSESIGAIVRRARSLHLEDHEIRGIRQSMFTEDGMLYRVLRAKAKLDKTHPPYIRVGMAGKGAFDDNPDKEDTGHAGFGSLGVLELWPSGHYSPIHSHGGTSGILLGLTGELSIMLYEKLEWESARDGLITLRQDQFAWLDPTHFPIHKVACAMDEEKTFGASFHVYLNDGEIVKLHEAFRQLQGGVKPNKELESRDEFAYVDEETHKADGKFKTYSDLSWKVLRAELARITAPA